jgi:predicted RNase H-like nuclease
MRVLGVDGCKGGWVAVALEDGVFAGSRFVDSIGDVASDPASVIGIDTPLGETTPGNRAADRSARAFLKPRSALVFPAPLLAALEAPTHSEGSAVSVAKCGKGVPKQAWGLRKYMLDARPHWSEDPTRLREVHPECSFKQMKGDTVTTKKIHWLGVRERLSLLGEQGIELLSDRHELPLDVPTPDVIDAAAAAWSAHRIALGAAVCMPDPPERDAEGRPVAIWR